AENRGPEGFEHGDVFDLHVEVDAVLHHLGLRDLVQPDPQERRPVDARVATVLQLDLLTQRPRPEVGHQCGVGHVEADVLEAGDRHALDATHETVRGDRWRVPTWRYGPTGGAGSVDEALHQHQ